MAEAQAKNNETLTMAIPASSDRQLNSVLEALMKKVDSLAEDIRGIKQALEEAPKNVPTPAAFKQDVHREPGYGPFGRPTGEELLHNIMFARMANMAHMMQRPNDEEFPELSESDQQDMLQRMRGPVTLSGWEHAEADEPDAHDGWDDHGESDLSMFIHHTVQPAGMLEEDRANALADETEETEEAILEAVKSRGTLFGMLIPHAEPELFESISRTQPEVVEVVEVEVAEVVEVVDVAETAEPEVEVVESAAEEAAPAVVAAEEAAPAVVAAEEVVPAVGAVEVAEAADATEPQPAAKKTRKKKDPSDVKPRGRKKQN
jgi:hypothetical protein